MTILALILIAVSLLAVVWLAVVWLAVDEHRRIEAAERWPDNWHELMK